MSIRRPWANSGRLYVTSVLVLVSFGMCQGLKCGPCLLASCPPAPKNCSGGITLDVCKCCSVCAKALNETCGGPFGIWGRCGDGMECAITPPLGSPITGSEKGVCREIIPKKCDKTKCAVSIKRKCPPDSMLIHNITDPAGCCRSFQCVCDPKACTKEKCLVGFESVLHHRAEGRPGACCDQYVCQPSEKCRSVMCPWTRGKDCPADSYKLPSKPSEDGCCYQPQECACKKCPPVLCPLGSRVQVLESGRSKPGRCCTQYQCLNETELGCHSDMTGKDYKDGETWKLDKCSSCTCQRGITFCKRQTCNNVTVCPYMEIPENECCPVCKGCLTESGRIVNNSDSWRENDCTTCTCVSGVAQCNSELCETKCLNPKKVPGQCCPVCLGDKTGQHPSCPDLRNCSLECPSGLQYSPDGCYKCKCKPANCYLDCRHGYKLNSQGQEQCECAKVKSRCPSLTRCNKQCTYGFKVMRNGCAKCKCNKCPPFKCTKKCASGFIVNEQDCQICKCRDDSAPSDPSVPTTYVPGAVDRSCLSVEGVRHEDGDAWHDGCRLCYCYNGQEMCALISCPRPNCDTPVFRLGDCCPTCPGNAITLPSTGQREACQSAEGLYFVEGETWHLDNCTECICHNGSILCETHMRQTICRVPTFPRLGCAVARQDTRMNMEMYGEPHPVRAVRVEMDKSTASRKPALPSDFDQHRGCIDKDTVYKHNNEWETQNCSKCLCLNGEKVCAPVHCPPQNCKYLIKSPDQCCPLCLETTSSAYTVSSPKDSTHDSGLGVSRERNPTDHDPSATIIITVLAILVIILLLLFAFCAYKFHRRRRCSKKSPDFIAAEVDTVKPVHVTLLGYESTENHWNNTAQILRDCELLSPLNKNSDGDMGNPKLLNQEKTINLLSPEFEKMNCARAEEKIYL
ncbi:hypothetical protein FSP39_001164 [Pinctada imbricata]|uniref:Cysteine-rich motor neuron 1 protein n=1 Tax=Pinctada imbricata TaxID=66713 RepID=A0AA88XUX7_PINIB|nr:hypothetical protein FSP39_001164 [Pinctada imbricata]